MSHKKRNKSATTLPAKKKRKYIQWTASEENEVKYYFRNFIEGRPNHKLPRKREVDDYLKGSQIVSYDWKTVKNKVMNEVAKATNKAKQKELSMGISV